MIHPFSNLPAEELKKLLNNETKSFIQAIDKGASVDQLKAIRSRIRDLTELLEKKVSGKEK